jgi:hypothetical protein
MHGLQSPDRETTKRCKFEAMITEYRQDKDAVRGWSKRIESEGLEFACAGPKFCFFDNG